MAVRWRAHKRRTAPRNRPVEAKIRNAVDDTHSRIGREERLERDTERERERESHSFHPKKGHFLLGTLLFCFAFSLSFLLFRSLLLSFTLFRSPSLCFALLRSLSLSFALLRSPSLEPKMEEKQKDTKKEKEEEQEEEETEEEETGEEEKRDYDFFLTATAGFMLIKHA